MNLKTDWFPNDNSKTDLVNVVAFIKELPNNLKMIFEEKSSNFKKTYFKEGDILSFDMFLSVFYESEEELKRGSLRFIRRQKIDNLLDVIDPYSLTEELTSIGFTGKSLMFKAKRINNIWQEIVDAVGKGIIDFANNSIVKLIRKFLLYLNSILGSLAKIFTLLDPIKEFKEIIESYIAVADE